MTRRVTAFDSARAIYYATMATPKAFVDVYRDEEFYFHDTVFQVCIITTPPFNRAISVVPMAGRE